MEMNEKLLELLKHYMKSEIAVFCNVQDTRAIDMWVARKSIPVKYHKIINQKYKQISE